MKKPEKGALQKAFQKTRKLVLLGAVPLMLGGCITTGPYQTGGFFGQPGIYGGSNVYNQGTGYQVSYTPTRQPWSNDPSYREEVRLVQMSSNLDLQQLRATYQTGLATCNSRFATSVNRNARASERAGRNGTTFGERLASGARWNQTSANFNACKVRVETRYREGVIREQQSFNRQVAALDKKYARMYGR